MSKRLYAQRRHIIASLDTLSFQLHAVSFFLSPSLLLSFCRLVAQFICLKPRELDSRRALRFYYTICILLNLPSICIHLIRGVVEGRAIILDFIGISCNPSKFQLCCLDLFILLLQLLLVTVSYETSVYCTTEGADIRLPRPASAPSPPLAQKDSSIFLASQPNNMMPIVIDLRLNFIAAHFHHAPLPSRRARHSLLPLHNRSPLDLSGVGLFLRPESSIQIERRTGGAATSSSRETRMPGAMDTTPDR